MIKGSEGAGENNIKTDKVDFNQIKQWLLNIVAHRALERSALIMECIRNFKFTKEELKNTSSDGVLTKAKSRTGSVLSKLIADGDLIVDEGRTIKLEKKIDDINDEDEIEAFIIEQIKVLGAKTKKEIFAICVENFNNKKTKLQENKIHLMAGNALSKLVKSEIVVKQNQGKYAIAKNTLFPNTEIGNCLKDACDSEDIYPYFIKAFNIKGGEFFEEFSVKLVEKYLAQSTTINSSKVTGGTNDNGIDGIIENTDYLGYQEKIFLQCKIRATGTITLKEVREFFGALTAESGTRGIFITNASFHTEATKFLNRQSNLIGIDGKKLYDLAHKIQYGIITTANKDEIDGTIFID
ncbi:MAG: restriction endonuclease [Clostridia bacterium]